MRIPFTAAVVILALYAAPALADRDPQSGAPKRAAQSTSNDSPITDHFFVRASFYSAEAGHQPAGRSRPIPRPARAAPPSTRRTTSGCRTSCTRGAWSSCSGCGIATRCASITSTPTAPANKVLANDIVFNNQTFVAGLATQSSFDWRQFDITYTYSFIRNERFEVGTGVALYFLQLEAIMQQNPPFALGVRQEVSAATPFPALPLDLTWRISSRWAATGRIAYLKAIVSGFNGWYEDAHMDVQYRWNPNFQIGLGYSLTRASLTREGGSFPGQLGLNIKGLEGFVRFSF